MSEFEARSGGFGASGAAAPPPKLSENFLKALEGKTYELVASAQVRSHNLRNLNDSYRTGNSTCPESSNNRATTRLISRSATQIPVGLCKCTPVSAVIVPDRHADCDVTVL